MSTKVISNPKELKKVRVYLPNKQLNKINELPIEGSLSIKLEHLIDIAFEGIKEGK